jgi:hypothetical protein
MKYLILLAICLLSGCATVAPDTANRYSELRMLKLIEDSVVPLPNRPFLQLEGDRAFLDSTGVRQLLQYKNVAETNTKALHDMVTLYNAVVEQYNELLITLTLEESRGNYYAELNAEMQNKLRLLNLMYGVLLATGAGVVLL